MALRHDPLDRDISSTRRQLLLGAGLMALGVARSRPALAANEGRSPRLVAIDWAAAETLLTMGICPLGVADLGGFLASLPGAAGTCSVSDLGSTWEPNLELIDRMRPAIIYISPWNRLSLTAFSSIAPVRISPIYTGDGRPLENALSFAQQIGTDFPQAARRGSMEALESRLALVHDAFITAPGAPVFILNLHGSGRFANVYGPASMAGNILAYLGLKNAWSEPTNGFGFARIGIDRLIAQKDASIIVIGQGAQTDRALQALSGSAIWNAIPAVRDRRVHQSPPLSIFGGLASAVGFGEWICRTLRPLP